MSIWVIGAIAYLAVLLFAFALARVASPPDDLGNLTEQPVDESDQTPTESAQAAGGNRG